MSAAPHCLEVEWPAPPGVRAAFSTRRGGLSQAPYASLNLGSHVGDDAQTVAANRTALAAHLKLDAQPCWLAQTHSDILIDLDDRDATRQGDAAITSTPGRVAAVMVADCLPVLLCDRDGRQVAAVHAGWRGLACELIKKAVSAFHAPPQELIAWLGPAIGPSAYGVGEDMRARFCALDARHADAFSLKNGQWHMDLARVAHGQLTALGVSDVSVSGLCVHNDAENFFSYRRDGETGRMAALVWLEGSA